MKKHHFLSVFIVFFMFFSQLSAQNGSKIRKNIKILQREQTFKNSVTAILVTNEKGKTIASWNPDMPLLTASTMKTITTGLSLNLLGPDYKFTTTISYTGSIIDSILNGNLIIIGGGDPTLGSKDTIAFPIDSIFNQWALFIKKAGIKKIKGSIIADDRFFENEPIPESWSWGNIGAPYGSAPSGLSYCENIHYFKIISGKSVGDSSEIGDVYPIVPEMVFSLKSAKASNTNNNRLSYFTSDLTRKGEFKGVIPSGEKVFNVTGSNKFPALSCAYHFREYLLKNGVDSEQKIIYASDLEANFDENRILIGKTYSKELFKIINVTNRISNNFYAETLLKMIGKTVTGHGSYDSSIVAVRRLLNNMKVPLEGFTQVDGSGLSRQDYVSPRFFCNYFIKMKESTNFAAFFNSLPQPGGPGTLNTVLKDVDFKKKSLIHAKSGSLSSVKCYAGYTVTKRGMYYFAFLTNNYSAPTSEMMKGIEEFMKALIK